MRRSFCVLFGLLCGCTGTLRQVPLDEPHGLVHLRFVHPSAEMAYENEAILDGQSPVSLRAETSVRLKPGRHFLDLRSTGRTYDLGSEIASRPGPTTGPGFGAGKVREEHVVMVEGERSECWHALELRVIKGKQLVAVLIAGPGDACSACVLGETAARSCP